MWILVVCLDLLSFSISAYQSPFSWSKYTLRSSSEIASSLTNWKSSPSTMLWWSSLPSSHVHLYYSYPNVCFLSAFEILAACRTSYLQLHLTQCHIHNYINMYICWMNEWISRTNVQIVLFPPPFAVKILWPIVLRLLSKLLLQQIKIVWGQEALLESMWNLKHAHTQPSSV